MKEQIKRERRDFPGSPAVKTLSSQYRRARVQSLVRELEPIMPQLKIPCASTKTWWSQIKKFKEEREREREIGGPGSKREVKESHDDLLPEVPWGSCELRLQNGHLEGAAAEGRSKKDSIQEK